MTVHLVSNQKIAETSSKGNQEKWLDSGIWYKLDQFGYEALAEVFTSQLLEYSNMEAAFPLRWKICTENSWKSPLLPGNSLRKWWSRCWNTAPPVTGN